MSAEEGLIQTLIGYRNRIKEITDQYPLSECSSEIKLASREVDEFIKTYEELLVAQRKFEQYTQGIIGSFSPQKEKGRLSGLFESKSFTEWSEMVSKCVGDASQST